MHCAAEPLPPEAVLPAHRVTAATAAAGVGAFFLVQSNHAKSDAAKLRTGLAPDACLSGISTACQSLNARVNSQFNDLNASTGLFVGAGGLAVIALTTWLVWPRSAPAALRTTGWLVPTIGGGTRGFQGNFE
jgi:hypothetical protein